MSQNVKDKLKRTKNNIYRLDNRANLKRMLAKAESQSDGIRAGAAVGDLTPSGSVFLFGYPHVKRMSSGFHDRLETNVLYVSDGEKKALFIANDLIFVSKAMTSRVRRRICEATGVNEECILISATHTHSGPTTVNYLSNEADPVVPPADPGYISLVEDRMCETAIRAFQAGEPAEIGYALAVAEETGSNRHDPRGPSDAEVPVLIVRSRSHKRPLACMLVHAMHPTVLHEDSTLVSADFPHFTRAFLRRTVLSRECPVLYHNGASGNQSPRHVTRANNFVEARRLGVLLARSIIRGMAGMCFLDDVRIHARTAVVDMQLRSMPSVAEAEHQVEAARQQLHSLRLHAPREQVRSAECDWFGAEETLVLAKAALTGRTKIVARTCEPAEIQVIALGDWKWVAWPGEFFVEYALEVKRRSAHTHVITMANGELQGYIATPEAAERQCYEARNALFSVSNGQRFVDTTLCLLKAIDQSEPAS